MKSELAEELLDKLMDWDAAAFQEKVQRLLALATYKFDEYGNFRPGVKFFESLAAWLRQFEDPAERATAIDFVLNGLIFISDAEMTHLIELVYPDHIELVLRRRVAELIRCSPYAISQIVGADAFKALRRRSLVLGASDGARLDRLRRSAPFLSHEQFLQSSEPSLDQVTDMRDKLGEALEGWGLNYPAMFEHVFLVDDFAGSGKTLLRKRHNCYEGKLARLATAIETLRKEGLLTDTVEVTIILYVATEDARQHLEETIRTCPLPAWEVRVVQVLPISARVDDRDPAFASLCDRYYDNWFTDEHKGRVPLGYNNSALPLVLSHNTPNNSVCLLWADSTAEDGSGHRRALFPRYERHHRDRP